MKTRREILQDALPLDLQHDISNEVLDQVGEDEWYHFFIESTDESPCMILNKAFDWENSKKGSKYWEKIQTILIRDGRIPGLTYRDK